MTEPSGPFDDELVRLFDQSLDLFCIAGFDGYFRRVNAAFERAVGYTQEELLARPFMGLVHPDDLEATRAALAKLAAGSDIVGFENRFICADGSARWLEWNTRTRPEEGFVYGVARDVTDRRVASAELNALRRVATLVAEGVQPQDLFAVVAEEVARVVDVPLVSVARYELDGTATECASFSMEGPLFPVGKRWSLEGTNVLRLVRASSEAARIDDYSQLEGEIVDAVRRSGIRSTVGIPIVVAGSLWGGMVVSSRDQDPLPEGTEARLADFTELLATAIANAESREALAQLAEQQAALRRVATLVARGVRPAEIFSAVSDEVGHLFGSETAAVVKFDPDGPAIVAVGVGKSVEGIPIGTRLEHDDLLPSTKVFRTGRSARADPASWASVGGPTAANLRRLGVVSLVASPIIVEGRLWGAMTVSTRDEPLPLDAEEHLEKFTELVATAIANADSRSELAASRRRIVAASDEARRRIERDLHDGAQQRLVSLALQLRAAQAAVPAELDAGGGAGPRRGRAQRRAGGAARVRARYPPGDPGRGRPRPGAADARPPLRRSGRAGHADRGPLAGARRGRSVLRRLRGAGERRQACARVDGGRRRRGGRPRAARLCPRRRRRRRRLRPRLGPGRAEGPGRGARRPDRAAERPGPGHVALRRAADQRWRAEGLRLTASLSPLGWLELLPAAGRSCLSLARANQGMEWLGATRRLLDRLACLSGSIRVPATVWCRRCVPA
jgi:PAS domain S-box-containing protein